MSRRFVLVKCCDYVNAGRFNLGSYDVLRMADELGLDCHDLIVHFAGTGPGGHNITTIKRARRAHSYLLVFAAPKASKTSEAVRPASDDAPAGPFLPAGAAVDGGSQPVIPAGDAAHAQGRGVPAINSIARNGTDNGSSVTCGFAGGAVPDGSFTESGSSPRRESQPQRGETGGPRMVPTASTSPEENR